MKKLLQSALAEKVNRRLLVFIVLLMCLLTIASQLEIFALGVITKKGPNFFELFAPLNEGKLEKVDAISWQDMQNRWNQIDSMHHGQITEQDADSFLLSVKHDDWIGFAIHKLNQHLSIDDNVWNLVYFLIAVAFFKALTLFAHRYVTRLMAIRVSRNLRQRYFEHIQSLSMSFYQKHNSGSLSSRVVGDSAMIAEAINACLVNYIQTPFTVLSTLTLCFLTSWQLSLIIFFGFPLIVLPIVYLAKRVKRISKQIQMNQEKFASVLIDFLAGIQTVKAFAREEFSLKKYREHNEKMASLERKSARYDLSSRPIIHTIGMFFLATALIYGLYVLQMGVPEVLFYAGMLYIFYEPIKKFAEENSHIQRGIAASERMFEVMETSPQIQDLPGAIELNEFQEAIEFQNVWFKYHDEWVLKGVDFKIRKGEMVAIVGPTGSGKSTIVQLIPRLYEAQQGKILIDGKPLHTFTQKSLRELISYVPQKSILFLDTVAANITFGKPYTDEQVKQAATKAHAAEFIERMPQKYHTELAEAGKNLSGGQQQRLAIARALVKQSPILIMDEATSSLDAVSEYRIKSAIQNLRGDMTQILIAHRLSTIEGADRIIYLEEGEKVAEGTKDQLLVSCPGFKKMWEMMSHSEKRSAS